MDIHSFSKEDLLDSLTEICMMAEFDDDFIMGYVNPDRNNDYGLVFEMQEDKFAAIPIRANEQGEFVAYQPTQTIPFEEPIDSCVK